MLGVDGGGLVAGGSPPGGVEEPVDEAPPLQLKEPSRQTSRKTPETIEYRQTPAWFIVKLCIEKSWLRHHLQVARVAPCGSLSVRGTVMVTPASGA